MTIQVITPTSMERWRDVAKPEMRHNLFSLAASAVSTLIDRYLRRIAPTRHKTADRLGASRTGHLERNTSFHATSEYAEVIIPIPGISRAFKDLSIKPKDKLFLTLPIASQSYGKTTKEMRSLGWMLFRPPAKGAHKTSEKKYSEYQDLLLGNLPDEKAVPLYLLKKRVEQRQDRTLLPSDAEMDESIAHATKTYLDLISKGAA